MYIMYVCRLPCMNLENVDGIGGGRVAVAFRIKRVFRRKLAEEKEAAKQERERCQKRHLAGAAQEARHRLAHVDVEFLLLSPLFVFHASLQFFARLAVCEPILFGVQRSARPVLVP